MESTMVTLMNDLGQDLDEEYMTIHMLLDLSMVFHIINHNVLL